VSNNIAIRVEGISKRYRLGARATRADTIVGAVTDMVKSPFRNFKRLREMTHTTTDEADDVLWALRDVSFSIQEGSVVGIIGRNGAGKSTLLKILSQITEPTSGRIDIYGRVASLLEVGTGFHSELTGRENVYLNGTILGMTKKEIDAKFDTIVDFSGVERFIDTAVKHYSSGMQVRLAFAVAAHLDPEILIIDEVLAVGDAQFQSKCLGKMQSIASTGRTILFVSHHMPSVLNLCDNAILLQNGSITQYDKTRIVVDSYLRSVSSSQSSPLALRADRSGSGEVTARAIAFLNDDGTELLNAISGQPVVIRIFYQCKTGLVLRDCRANLVVRRSEELSFVLSSTTASNETLTLAGTGYIDFRIAELPLAAGSYALTSILESNVLYDAVENAAQLVVTDGDYFGTGRVRPSPDWVNVGVLVRHSCASHQS
jgi:lipopolysaccharide transport system ATP-binding protein